jgi:hypothetical protein
VTLITVSAFEPDYSTLDSTCLVVTDANDDGHDNFNPLDIHDIFYKTL